MERGKAQTHSSLDLCSGNGPDPLGSSLPREIRHSPDLFPTLSSAKPIYSQGEEELCLIAVTTCRVADVFRHRTIFKHSASPNIPWDKCFYKAFFMITVRSNHKRREFFCRSYDPAPEAVCQSSSDGFVSQEFLGDCWVAGCSWLTL